METTIDGVKTKKMLKYGNRGKVAQGRTLDGRDRPCGGRENKAFFFLSELPNFCYQYSIQTQGAGQEEEREMKKFFFRLPAF